MVKNFRYLKDGWMIPAVLLTCLSGRLFSYLEFSFVSSDIMPCSIYHTLTYEMSIHRLTHGCQPDR